MMPMLLSLCLTAAPEPVQVRPADSGAGLANPGMGWVLHYYDNNITNYGSRLAPADTVAEFPGLQVVYLRLAWSFIEPEEGRFEWSIVDTPAQRWIAQGKQIAFRFTCSETPVPYATPQWVEAAGAKGHRYNPGQGIADEGSHWEPDYDDPIFLAKLDNFLAAAGARYDGRPEVAFIDVGTFGVWGEGHTFHTTKLGYSAETVIRHIDLHRKHFPHTLLAANDDYVSQERGPASIDYAAAHGLTLRDDSILVQPPPRSWYHAEMAQAFWPTVPVILESEHYGPSKAREAWGDGSLYLQAVEEYHAALASIHWWPHEFLAEQRPVIDAINRRLGYRLQLVEASWPQDLRLGERLEVSMTWRNAGVAPCYPGGFPSLCLRDEEGGLAGVFVLDGLQFRDLPVAAPGAAASRTVTRGFDLPWGIRPGTYIVQVSAGDAQGTPVFNLPLADGDATKRYTLGQLTIRGDFDARAGELTAADGGWQLPVTWTIRQPLEPGLRPFLHADRDGRIAWQGHPVTDELAALADPGEHHLAMRLAMAADAAGEYEVWAGLFYPDRLGRPDERVLPDRLSSDRRVKLGTLTLAPGQAPRFIPEPR